MAFRLTKAEERSRQSHVRELAAAQECLEHQRAACNQAVRSALAALQVAVDAYNTARREAQAFTETVRERLQDEHDDKGDRWQDGEYGTAAREMAEAWDVHLDEAASPALPTLEPQDLLAQHVPQAARVLEDLPDEATAI